MRDGRAPLGKLEKHDSSPTRSVCHVLSVSTDRSSCKTNSGDVVKTIELVVNEMNPFAQTGCCPRQSWRIRGVARMHA